MQEPLKKTLYAYINEVKNMTEVIFIFAAASDDNIYRKLINNNVGVVFTATSSNECYSVVVSSFSYSRQTPPCNIDSCDCNEKLFNRIPISLAKSILNQK